MAEHSLELVGFEEALTRVVNTQHRDLGACSNFLRAQAESKATARNRQFIVDGRRLGAVFEPMHRIARHQVARDFPGPAVPAEEFAQMLLLAERDQGGACVGLVIVLDKLKQIIKSGPLKLRADRLTGRSIAESAFQQADGIVRGW